MFFEDSPPEIEAIHTPNHQMFDSKNTCSIACHVWYPFVQFPKEVQDFFSVVGAFQNRIQRLTEKRAMQKKIIFSFRSCGYAINTNGEVELAC